MEVAHGKVQHKNRMPATARSGTLGVYGTTCSPNVVQYVIFVFVQVRRACFCHVKEPGTNKLEHIPAHTLADCLAIVHGLHVPMAADSGNVHEPHQHDGPQDRQHVLLSDSGRRPRPLPVVTASMFALTTRLGPAPVMSTCRLVRVLLDPT